MKNPFGYPGVAVRETFVDRENWKSRSMACFRGRTAYCVLWGLLRI